MKITKEPTWEKKPILKKDARQPRRVDRGFADDSILDLVGKNPLFDESHLPSSTTKRTKNKMNRRRSRSMERIPGLSLKAPDFGPIPEFSRDSGYPELQNSLQNSCQYSPRRPAPSVPIETCKASPIFSDIFGEYKAKIELQNTTLHSIRAKKKQDEILTSTSFRRCRRRRQEGPTTSPYPTSQPFD